MPVCQKCSIKFSNLTVIDGKTRNLCSRRYCLDCSPWMAKKDKKPSITSECRECKRQFVYNRKAGHRLHICNSCSANKRRFRIKRILVEYKGGKCIRCGYDSNFKALAFHHRDPSSKDFDIGGSHCRSLEKMKAEVDKCDLLCFNCHVEVHDEMVGGSGERRGFISLGDRVDYLERVGPIPTPTTTSV